jgi:hypothetical protein
MKMSLFPRMQIGRTARLMGEAGLAVILVAAARTRTGSRSSRTDLGILVGSGVVEAGCKAVIGQRLKLSGMRWNIPGATAIATLRCQQPLRTNLAAAP